MRMAYRIQLVLPNTKQANHVRDLRITSEGLFVSARLSRQSIIPPQDLNGESSLLEHSRKLDKDC